MFLDIFLLSLFKPFYSFAGDTEGGGDGDGGGDSDGSDTAGDDKSGASGDDDGDDSSGSKDSDGSKDKEQATKDTKLPDDFNQEKWDKSKEVDLEKWGKLKDIDVEKHSEAMELLESVKNDEELYDKVLKTIQGHKEKSPDPETQKRLDAVERDIAERNNKEARGKFETHRDEVTTEAVKETSLKELSEFEKDYVNNYVLDQFESKDLKIDQMKTVVKEAVQRLEKNHRDRLGRSVRKEGSPDPIKDGKSGNEKEGRNLKDSEARVKDSYNYLTERLNA